MAQARSFFEKAIALDPENVEAMVGLARVDAAIGAAVMTDDWSARFAAAEATLTKVLSLAPNHALAHVILGLVQMFTNRAAQGIAECEQALALDRNLARAHALIGLAKYLSWSRRRNRSSHQRGIPPFSSRHLGSSMDGMGRPCQGAARRRCRSGHLDAPGPRRKPKLFRSRISISRPHSRGSESWTKRGLR